MLKEQLLPASLKMKLDLPEAELQRIPSSGGLLLLAGRPYGLVEACALLPALLERRPDLKVLEDSLLEASASAPELSLGPGSPSERWDRAEERLRQGAAVLAFVGAPLAAGKAQSAPALAEATRLVALARASGATLQVMRLDGGKRRPWLRALGLDKPGRRRAAMGPALRSPSPKLTVSIGAGLSAARLRLVPRDHEAGELLALRFWLLAHRGLSPRRSAPWRQRLRRMQQRPLASPLPPALLENELSALPESAKLAVSGGLECWVAPALSIPNLLREIGRLRELSFRAVGEGSGQPLDLDSFDGHYLQLFLWDPRYPLGGRRLSFRPHGQGALRARARRPLCPQPLAFQAPAAHPVGSGLGAWAVLRGAPVAA
jgi:hypothetical protein